MEFWNFKVSSGYISEFDQESVPDLSPIDGSISLGGSSPKGDLSFDLKLGRNTGNKERVATSSSKRTRGNNGPICLVDGCDSDFSNCREYHKRHKVCEVHSKTPVVKINGHKQRFCQQCSRFHSLEEFDDGKRSCRKRLDGHNRRRRKPQPDHLTRPPNFFTTTFQGSKLLEFSHVFPTTSVGSPSWGDGVVGMGRGIMFPISSSSSSSQNSRAKQFPFLQEEEESSRMTSCIHASDCALSLLSSSSSSAPLLHPSLSLSQDAVFYGSGLFENASAASDGSVISGNEPVPLPQTFPFHWE